jgi:hypothetical protein
MCKRASTAETLAAVVYQIPGLCIMLSLKNVKNNAGAVSRPIFNNNNKHTTVATHV